LAHGKTALEIEPNGVATQEVAALWQAVQERLEENEKFIATQITGLCSISGP